MVSDTATAFRAAKDGVNRANDADNNADKNDGLEFGDAQHAGHAKDIFKNK